MDWQIITALLGYIPILATIISVYSVYAKNKKEQASLLNSLENRIIKLEVEMNILINKKEL